MLSRGEAVSKYDGLIDLLMENDYFFHTSDGETLAKGEFNYDTLISNLGKMEYLDTVGDDYNRYYINPVMRFLILLSVDDPSSDIITFKKISYELISFIYDQLRASAHHGYRLALDDVRQNVSNLFKEDRSIQDVF